MLLIGTLALAALVHSADTTKKKTDSLPLVADRNLDFETTEGTWMSLDVSPDGQTIVFELLGDIYTMPISGGTTKAITSGPPFDSQPRWSPDGNGSSS
jgi:Tol biopolymer transport system component